MKRILLTLLAVVVVIGLFAAVGYAGYRFGFSQGAETVAEGGVTRPGLRPFDEFSRRGLIPRHDFEFARGFPRMPGGGSFMMLGLGFLRLLVPMTVLTLVVLFAYWLFTRSGWRLTRTTPLAEAPPPPPAETAPKE
jgi:hypothetical protein